MKSNRFILCLQILLLLCLATGCGKKTNPVPPQTALPEKISDLALQVDETGVTLTWSWPERTEYGGKVRKLSYFMVEKAKYSKDNLCKECPVKYDTRFRVDGGPLPADKESRLIQFHDSDLQHGHLYLYRISSSIGWNINSKPSEPVTLSWEIPLAAPEKLSVNGGDNRADLYWEAVSHDTDNTPVTGRIFYTVFRSSVKNSFTQLADRVSQTHYSDRRVVNGESYKYKVMAARDNGGIGRFSRIVEAKPQDMTPPPAPRNLKAIKTAGGIILTWDPIGSEDLAGYKIFRRNSFQAPKPDQVSIRQDTEHKEIGLVLKPAVSFTDATPPLDVNAWHYAVGSFDTAIPPNISPLSWEVKIKREQ